MTEKILFCTYFDRYYLPKGLSLYLSLRKYHASAQIWVLCMDDYTYQFLKLARFAGIKLISLQDFEDNDLKKVKNTRSKIEYYWTCTPSLPLYVISRNPDCSNVVYLDSDIFIFSSLDLIFKELGNHSIYLAEHRYPDTERFRENISGRFNVGILIFKNDKEGLSCLTRWRKQCLNWCFFREEKGKMGDQAYLNDWPKLYKKAVISKNLGFNAAPWNISQYQITKKENSIAINSDKLISYHFHGFKVLGKNKFSLCSQYLIPKFEYHLTATIKNFIYEPYVESIKESLNFIFSKDNNFHNFESRKFISLPNLKSLFNK